jgi:putative hydrolases of HD superfamily
MHVYENAVKDSNLLYYRCMELSLVHDMGESIIGDITPFCGVPRDEKIRREREAIEKLASLAGSRGDKIRDLFHVSRIF